MGTNYLIEVTPVKPDGTITTIRMSRRGVSQAGVYLDNKQWLPLLETLPTFSLNLMSSGQLQIPTISYGDLEFICSDAYANEEWSSYDWSNALASCWYGEDGQPFSEYTQVFSGRVSGFNRQEIYASVALLGSEADLQRPALFDEYEGTGGLEGGAGIKGTLKPRAHGFCKTVSPVQIDTVYLVYQVHGYGPIAGISKVYDFAQELEPAIANVSTYNELIALELLPGQWASCNTHGLFRLGGSTDKKLTCDVMGALHNGVYTNTVKTITQQLIREVQPTATFGTFGSFADAEWCFYAKEATSVADIVYRAVYEAGGYLVPDGVGRWQVGDFYAPVNRGQLRSDRSSLPLVIDHLEKTSTGPVWKVSVGHSRCWSVHTESEISPTIFDASGLALTEDLEDALEQLEVVKSDITLQLSRLDAMVADGILDRAEKKYWEQEYARQIIDRNKLVVDGSQFDVSAEVAAYQGAATYLTNYLNGLVPAWNDGSQDTPINRVTFKAAWESLYSAKLALTQKMTGRASEKAIWDKIIGSGKPDDNATVGAPAGTNVAGVPAEDIVNGVTDENGKVIPLRSLKADVEETQADIADLFATLGPTNSAMVSADAAQTAADVAQAAKEVAVQARSDAQAAFASADAAQDAASDYASAANLAKAAAETARNTALTHALTSSTAATNAQTAKTLAENAFANSTTAKDAAVAAKTAAETARTQAQTAKTAAEAAFANSTTAKDAAVAARTASELARDNAQTKAADAAGSATSAAGHAQTAQTNSNSSAISASASAASAVVAQSNADMATYLDVAHVSDFTASNVDQWYAGPAATVTGSSDGLIVSGTGGDTYFARNGLNMSGSRHTRIIVELTRISSRPSGNWDGSIYWSTSVHGWSGSYRARFADIAVGTRSRIVVDMSVANDGAADWLASTITGIRLDFDNGAADIKVHNIRIVGPDGAAPAKAAMAAATSASSAATSASLADHSATAAQESETVAITKAAQASTSAGQASTSATNAAGSASAASTSASSAANSATQSGNSASAASTSASTAATRATEAAQSATSANTSATTATTKAGNANTSATQASNSATTASGHASNASTSADAAAGSATNASNSATAASGSANTATTKATEASNSATAAAASAVTATSRRNEAQAAATAAATSASGAATSATNAGQSATAAQNSATAANTSAGNASTAAGQASTSATNAAGSASAASTSASNAAGSALNAGNSATAASGSASTAATHATNAGNSASAANTSAISAASSFNAAIQSLAAAPQLPFDFTDGLNQWTTDRHGSPASVVPAVATLYGQNDGIFGSYADFSLASIGSNIMTRGVVPANAGRVYEVRAKFRVREGDGAYSFTLCVASMDAAYGIVNTQFPLVTAVTGSTTTEIVGLFSDTASSGVTAWPANTFWLRFGLRTNTSEAGMSVRIGSIRVTDVTEKMAAQGFASNASVSASQAATSATSAAGSASTASTQASLAAGSATNASNSASAANTSAGAAATQATNAGNSATAANSSALNAASRRDEAANSATAAATSASNAATSATNAGQSATSASTSANTASTKAGEATTSASSAATSASNALGYRNTASTHATNAATSATNALNNATAASGSASTAGTHATNAGNSATAANTSAVSAASSFSALQGAIANNSVALPFEFTEANAYWTAARSGSPASVGPAAGTFIPNDSLMGPSWEITNWTTAGQNIMTRGVVPATPGRFYEVKVRFRTTVKSGPTASFNVMASDMASDYSSVGGAYVAGTVINVATSTVISEVTAIFSDTTTNGASAWNAAAKYVRFGLRLNSQENGLVLRISEIRVTDITERLAAQNSAAAASGSASSAATSANAANTSANAASGSATTASTKAAEAAGSAGAAATSASAASSASTASSQSASAAEQSRLSAEAARNAALGHASAASTSAGSAAGSATAAGNSAGAAQTSATNASTSAGQASTSASNASTSAGQASTSASNALGYRNTASTHATNAANSATNAGNSATAASGSASTATTKATEAGNSATSAASSAVSAASSFNSTVQTIAAAPQLPFDFADGANQWTDSRYGSPSAAAPATGWASTGDVLYGNFMDTYWTTAGQNILTRGVVPATAGRVYEVRIRFRVTQSDGSVTYNLIAAYMNETYGSGSFVGAALTTVTSLDDQEMVALFSDTASSGVTAWPSTTKFMRFGLRLNGGETGLVTRIASIRVTDVTDKRAAAGSASAAAASASSASTSATAAGQSATSASGSANTAATQAGNASSSASSASTSAANSNTSAGLAAGSATAAANSATAASGHANTAQTKAGEAASSASSANTSAAAASASASSASTSASNASTFKGQAETAANTATSQATVATSAAAAAQSSAVVSASIAAASINGNPVFADWPTGQEHPTGYALHAGSPAIGRAAGITSPYAYNVHMTATNAATVGVKTPNYTTTQVISQNMWVVLEVDMQRLAGSLAGSCALFRALTSAGVSSQDMRIDFNNDADIAGVVGDGGTNVRRWRKLVQFTNASVFGWTIFLLNRASFVPGYTTTTTASNLVYHRVAFRPATDQEIASQKATSDISSLSSTVSTQAGVISELNGRTSSYLEMVTAAGSASAAVRLVAANGATSGNGSGIELQADSIRLGSAKLRAMDVVGGNVTFHGRANFVGGLMVSPSGQTSIDMTTGTMVFNNGGVMKVTGTGFGSSNQFIEWSGPSQTSLSNCTEANAISFLKTNGQAYYAGGIIAGTLKSSMSNTSQAASASTSTGTITSNGNTVSVNGSYALRSKATVTFPASQTGVNDYNAALAAFGSANTYDGGFSHEGVKTNNPSGSFNMTIKRDGGTLVGHSAINGSITLYGLRPTPGDAPGRIDYTYDYWSSTTTSDPYLNTSARSYSAEFSRGFSYSGSIDTQYISVTSTEW